jgi:hypothetical protein
MTLELAELVDSFLMCAYSCVVQHAIEIVFHDAAAFSSALTANTML